jgi:tetratricopeptide (TPR) repeat protein
LAARPTRDARVTDPALAAAAAQSRAAIARGTGDAYDHAIVALANSAAGDYAAADRLFDTALAMEPGNPATLTSLAIHYRRQGRNRDAVLACDAAIRAHPAYPDAWLERASILATGGSIAAARDSYARAAALAPQLAAPLAGLAALAAREGDHGAALAHGQAALARDPANATAITAVARAEAASGQPAAAAARLEPLLARLHEPSLERSLAHSLMGDLAARRGAAAPAFAHYQAANDDFAAIHAHEAGRHLDQRSFVEAIAEGLAATSAADWRVEPAAKPPGAATRHIFLLGYPRSGTTLLENILASLPGVFALEERPTLAAVDQDFIAGSPDDIRAGVAGFAALGAAALDRYRTAYWDGVRASAMPPAASALVDMDPLKGTRLPFIARLFPDARILLMRRDPRDVVWSCFRTNFAVSSGTLEYTSLERAARHYDALMRLTELALDRLPLTVREVHYHRLVQSFEAETREICAFAGLDWSDAVRQFDTTAARRGTSTASVSQVRRGLYDGTRQWEAFADFLAPVMPILQPWIDRFGYAD